MRHRAVVLSLAFLAMAAMAWGQRRGREAGPTQPMQFRALGPAEGGGRVC